MAGGGVFLAMLMRGLGLFGEVVKREGSFMEGYFWCFGVLVVFRVLGFGEVRGEQVLGGRG